MDVFVGGAGLLWKLRLAEFPAFGYGGKQGSGSTVARRAREQVIQSHVQQLLLSRRERREWKRPAIAWPQFHGRTPDACDLRRRSRHADARVQKPIFAGTDSPTCGLCHVVAERRRGASASDQ